MFIKAYNKIIVKREMGSSSKEFRVEMPQTVYFDENRKTNTYVLEKIELNGESKTLVRINTQTLDFQCILEENEKLKDFFFLKGLADE